MKLGLVSIYEAGCKNVSRKRVRVRDVLLEVSSKPGPFQKSKGHGCRSTRIDGWRNDQFVRAAQS
jgi:hypothetical protein